MANSHPGSYCGQDAYNNMLVTERDNENINIGNVSSTNNRWNGSYIEGERLQRPTNYKCEGGYNEMDTAVRRLTPLECERLQGFPDNWTLIGEPEENKNGEIDYYYIDTQGKKKKVTDSARYKALGNSICTPFWAWMARRICAQYERDVTMGSLFDGIGGFPYVFEKCGAKAVWASEIEEFPIAVTKQHFGEEGE